MKIFVFAYNRYTTMTTSNLLVAEGIEHYVMVHSEDDKHKFKAGGTLKIDDEHIIVTGNPKGLTRQRNYALDMLKFGEWAIFMNDDLRKVTMFRDYEKCTYDKIKLSPNNIKVFDEYLKTPISCRKLFQLMETTIKDSAEKEGARLVGFVAHNNTKFRARKLSKKGLVDGRLWMFKKEMGMRFDENVNVLEDHEFTAQHLCRYGCVHIENWICPEFSRMTKGGFGTLPERTNQLRQEAAYLIKKYGFLFEYKDKKNYPPYTQLQFKF